MNTIDMILNEAEEIDLAGLPSEVDELVNKYEQMGCTVQIDYHHESSLYLRMIRVPEDRKNSGIGSSFMKEFAAIGDKYGVVLTLSQSTEYGSSMTRLINFYKRFGFRLNKGRKADHRFWASMIREPQN